MDVFAYLQNKIVTTNDSILSILGQDVHLITDRHTWPYHYSCPRHCYRLLNPSSSQATESAIPTIPCGNFRE